MENKQKMWDECIAAYESSGQTVKAWCAEHNLKMSQFEYHLYKNRKSQKEEQLPITATTFREIKLNNPSTTQSSLPIQIGPVQIEIRTGFDPQLLRDIITALEYIC